MDVSYQGITTTRYKNCFKIIIKLIEVGAYRAEILNLCKYALSDNDPYGTDIPYQHLIGNTTKKIICTGRLTPNQEFTTVAKNELKKLIKL